MIRQDLSLFTRHGKHHIGTIALDPAGPADKTAIFTVSPDVYEALAARSHPITPIHHPEALPKEAWELRMCGHPIGRCSTQTLHDMAHAFRVDMPEGEPDMLADDIQDAVHAFVTLQNQLATVRQKMHAQAAVLDGLYAQKNARACASQGARMQGLGQVPPSALFVGGIYGFTMRSTTCTQRPELHCIISAIKDGVCSFHCTNGDWDGTVEISPQGALIMRVHGSDTPHTMCLVEIEANLG